MTNWDGREYDSGISADMPNDGKWSHHSWWRNANGHWMGFCIRVPQQYLDDPNRGFPVIYACHGSGSDENTVFVQQTWNPVHPWTRWYQYVDWVDSNIGQDWPVIFVTGNGFHSQKWWDTKPGAPSYGNMMPMSGLFELIDYVEQNWRTINDQKLDSRPVCATQERFTTIRLWIRILRIARPISSFSANS